MTETERPQEGQWTLTAPDGRTWVADTPPPLSPDAASPQPELDTRAVRIHPPEFLPMPRQLAGLPNEAIYKQGCLDGWRAGASPQPEPVAWRYRYRADGKWQLASEPAMQWAADHSGFEEEPLYAAPPVQPPPISESELLALLPGTHYMDPPDGGDVSLIEQLRRMSADAARWRAAVAPVQPGPEDAVHGRCSAWLRLFKFKHEREPYPQEVWDAAKADAAAPVQPPEPAALTIDALRLDIDGDDPLSDELAEIWLAAMKASDTCMHPGLRGHSEWCGRTQAACEVLIRRLPDLYRRAILAAEKEPK